mmetsp:Transcript_44820/g.103510  ORF Transcript_44820/g.103510 Transcript_44820/m.103510 type:complete len:292 (-) Transcript_44820:359-1234(-)
MNLAVVEDENRVGAGVGLHHAVDERGDVLEEEFRVVRAHHVASRDKTLGCEKGKHRDHLPAMHHLDYAHALPHSAPTVLPPYGPAVHRRLVGEQEPGRVERARIDLVPVGSPLDLVASSSDLLHLLERYAGRVQRAVKVLAAEADLREAQVHLVRNVREVEPRILIDNLEHRLLVQSGHPLHPRLARREGDCDRLPESLERVVDRPLADAGPRRPVNVRDVRDVEGRGRGTATKRSPSPGGMAAAHGCQPSGPACAARPRRGCRGIVRRGLFPAWTAPAGEQVGGLGAAAG